MQEIVVRPRGPMQFQRIEPRMLADQRSETSEQDGEDAGELGKLLWGAETVRR